MDLPVVVNMDDQKQKQKQKRWMSTIPNVV